MHPQSSAYKLLVHSYRQLLRRVRASRRAAAREVSAERQGRLLIELLQPRLMMSVTASGSETLINTNTPGAQSEPTVAMDRSGASVIVWTSANGGTHVDGQRFDTSGNPAGGEFQVNVSGAGSDPRPIVAMDDAGGFLVSWDSGSSVYARVFDSAGAALTGETQVATNKVGLSPTCVTMTPAGQFMVAWEGNSAQDSDGIYARKFTATGLASGAAFLVNTTTAGVQTNPAVAVDVNGNYAVAWTDLSSGSKVKAVYLPASGAGSSEIVVGGAGTDTEDQASVGFDGSGKFVVAWAESAPGYGIFSRRYQPGGTAIDAAPVAVSSWNGAAQSDPAIAVRLDGSYLVSWTDSGGHDGNGYGVFAQAFTTTGAGDGAEFLVNTTTAGNQQNTGAAWTGGTAAVVWDGNGAGDAAGIFLQRYTTSQPADQAPVNTVPAAQSITENNPLAFSSANGNAISVSDADAYGGTEQVTLTVSAGTLSISDTTGITFVSGAASGGGGMSIAGTIANLNAALAGLVFTPARNNVTTATLQIVTDDLGNTGSGGPISSTSSVSIQINAPSNPANSVIPGAQTITLNKPLVFMPANGNQINIGSSWNAVQLTVSHGTLTLATTSGLSFGTGNGTANATMSFSGSQSAYNAALNGLIYTPTTGYTGSDTLQIITTNSGLLGLGLFGSSTTSTVALTVSAAVHANQAPAVSLPAAQSTDQNAALVFNGNTISVSDADANGLAEKVTLVATSGTLTLGGTGGLSFISGTGTNDSSEAFTGTLASIDAALNGMRFLPAPNFVGSGGIDMSIDDLGNTGTGGALNNSGSVAITIFNNPPAVAEAAGASPAQVNGTTTMLSVLGADDGGESNLTYTWAATGTPPAPVSFSDNSDNTAQNVTATFAAAGTYNLQVTSTDVQGASVTSAVVVNVNQTFTSATVAPASATVSINGQQQFTATALDQFGNVMSTQPNFNWSATGPGTISNTGLYTAPGVGESTIVTATSGSISGTAAVSVNSGGTFDIPSGGETLVNTASTNGTQQLPAVAMGSSGNFVVVWEDGAGSGEVNAQLYNAAGNPVGGQFQVNTTGAGGSPAPSVAMNASGAFVVCWNSGGPNVYVQLYNAAGTAVGGNTLVTSQRQGNSPSGVAMAGDGSFTVVFEGNSAADNDGIYAQRFSASGVASGAPFLVNTTTQSSQLNASIATDSQGNSVVAWTDQSSGSQIKAALLPASGAPSAEFLVSTTGDSHEDRSDVGMDASGNFVITWSQTDGSQPIYARRYNAAATALDASPVLLTNANASNAKPAIAVRADGSYLIAWTGGSNQDGNGNGVFAQAFTSGGAFNGGEFLVNTTTQGNQQDAAVAWQGNAAVIAWDGNGAGDSNGIFFQSYLQAPTIATPAAASPSPVTGTTANFSVLGADDRGESSLTYTWAITGTPPAAVAFSANGTNAAKSMTATFTMAGTYNFQVTITDAVGLPSTSSVTVVVSQTLTSIGVTPGTASLVDNGAQQFSASGYDQFGAPMNPVPVFTWTNSGLGSVDGTGLYTAPGAGLAGSATVVAASGSISGSASISVSNSLALLSGSATDGAAAVDLTAAGTLDWIHWGNGSAPGVDRKATGGSQISDYTQVGSGTGPAPIATDARPVSWTDGSPDATHSESSNAGTALESGLTGHGYSFTVPADTNTRQLLVYVGTKSAALGTLTAHLSDNSAPDYSSQNNFASTDGTYTLDYRAGAPGQTLTVSWVQNSGGPTKIRLVAAALASAFPTVVNPAAVSPIPVTGTTATLSVLGADTGGESNLLYTWATTGSPPAPVNFSIDGTNAAKNTTATFTKAGTYYFKVTITNAGGLFTTSSVTVTVSQTPTSISVAPSAPQLAFNATQQLTATALDQFGNPLAPQPAFTWSITSGAGSISPSGLYTAPASLTIATATVTGAGIGGSASVSVFRSVPALVVDTAADVVDGNTSSVASLLASPGADGKISLREAILAADNTSGTTPIYFNIGGGGAHVISVTSALPTITNPVIIDATSQAGFTNAPLIEVNGSLAGATANGLTIVAGNSTVRGLVIDGFGGDGIELSTNGNDLITGNYIGTDSTGTAADPNGGYGVDVASGSSNTVGGATAGAGNVISGNTRGGIRVTGGSFLVSEDNNVVRVDAQTGAVLATYATGLANDSVAVGSDGSFYVPDYYNNLIQHYDAAGTLLSTFGSGHLSSPQDLIFGPDGNLYVGNVGGGIQRFSPTGTFLSTFIPNGTGGLNNVKGMAFGPDGNLYVDNLTGSDVLRFNGTTGALMGTFVTSGSGGLSTPEDLAFGADGNLYVSDYANGTIDRYSGSNGASLGTFVSGIPSAAYGFRFDAAGNLDVACRSTGSIVTYNGQTGAFLHNLDTGLTNPAWFTATPAPSQGDTIQGNYIGTDASGVNALGNSGDGIQLDSQANGNSIGGGSAGQGNTIAFNTGDGVDVAGAGRVTVSRNSVYKNSKFGIDLTSDVATPATGTLNAASPNAGMNYPVLTRADVSGGQLTVAGYIGSAPNQSAFAGATVEFFQSDATAGTASGRTYLGTLTGDANGNFAGTLPAGALAAGAAVTATATSPVGATSQFAAARAINVAPTVAVLASASPNPDPATTAALSVLGADDGGESNLTYTWATTGTPPAAVTFSVNGTNAAKNTTATFTKAGTYSVQVTITDSGGLTTTSSATVTVNQTLTTINVSPASAFINENGTQQFTAAASDQFGNAMATVLTWSIASGPGAVSQSGLYTASTTVGMATVRAIGGSVFGTASVTVTNAAPTVATAAVASPGTVTGTTTSLSVLGADDGGEPGLTYLWATTGTPPAPVSFSDNNDNSARNTTATFTRAGIYNFRVSITDAGGLTATSTASVTVNQTFTSIAVTPATATLSENGTQQFTATARDQFGNAMASAPAFTWSSTAGSVSASGLYTALGSGGSGTATVTASSGSLRGTASVAVTNAAPTVAVQASASPSPVTGTTTSLSALGADDGGESHLTYTWATIGTPPAPVSFSTNGNHGAGSTIATFAAAGTYTFRVTISDAEGLTATSSVPVTVNQALGSIAVTPSAPSMSIGEVKAFTASAFDQFGSAMATPPVFTWSASSGAIDASGSYTAPAAAGGYAITAASGAVRGTAAVAVTNGTSIAASPNPVAGATSSLSVAGAAGAGLIYTWSATSIPMGAASPTFSTNGSAAARATVATFTGAGSYTLQVRISDGSGSSIDTTGVTVLQTLTSIAVAPSTVTLNPNDPQQFTALGYDQFGQPMPSAGPITWSVSSGVGGIDSSGLYTAPNSAGSATIDATNGTISGQASISVAYGVAHAPSVTGASTSEDVQTTSGLVISPSRADNPSATWFRISTITGGTLFQNDGVTPINDGDFVSAAQGSAGLRFTPSPGSTSAGAFDVQASTTPDATGIGGAAVAASIAVRGRPVIAVGAAPLSYTEGQGAAAIDAQLSITDPASTILVSATVQLTGYVPSQDVLAFPGANGITAAWDSLAGRLTLSGAASVASYQDALRSVTFENTSQDPDTSARTAQIVVNDGVLSSTLIAKSINVTAINNPPLVTVPGTQIATEGTPLLFSSAAGTAITVSDPDANGAAEQVSLTASGGTITLPQSTGLTFSTGSATSGAASMTFTGTLADINADLDGLAFTPMAGYVGPASIAVVADDLGNTGVGGPLTVSQAASIAVEAPAGITVTPTSGLTTSDNGATADFSIVLTRPPTADVTIGLQSSNTAAGMATVDSLTFTPADWNIAQDVTVTGFDDTATTATRVNFQIRMLPAASADPLYAGLNAPDVNLTDVKEPLTVAASDGFAQYLAGSAPVAVDSGLTLQGPAVPVRNARVTLTSGYLGGADRLVFSPQGHITGSWDKTTGALILSGRASVSEYETALRSVSYVNSNPAAPASERTIDFSVTNDGGTSSASRSLQVVALSAPPVILAPVSQQTAPDAPLLFSQATGNAVAIVDPDAGDSVILASLTARKGSLTLPNVQGLTFTLGSSSGSLAVQVSGTLKDVNAALDGLQFTPFQGYAGGGASLRIDVNDLGNSGDGIPRSASRTVPIAVQTPIILPTVPAVSPPPATTPVFTTPISSPVIFTPVAPTYVVPGPTYVASGGGTSDMGLPTSSTGTGASTGNDDGPPGPSSATPKPDSTTPARSSPEASGPSKEQSPASVPRPSQQQGPLKGQAAAPAARPQATVAAPRPTAANNNRPAGAPVSAGVTPITVVPADVQAVLSDASPMWEKLDQLHESLVQENRARIVAGTASFISVGASVLYLAWIFRAGTLVSSLLSSLPVWRFVDPLPILDQVGGRAREEDDEESLQSMVSET